ncbi:yippee zinc-binding/DNA-binding /Mis18, centromere assembly-domain-containing protein [Cladochytrium replicatum]|nr:yippee zinc-binding/DNA-binding /Mis18, centromere assembly-domain-containing protein [Cladochytrium replicatum]
MGIIYRRYIDPKDASPSSRIFGCLCCKTHLSSTDEIYSRAFHGQHGKAYLFNKVINVTEGEPQDRSMTTGLHNVTDIMCATCQTVVGWKYIKAYEETQKYKEGKFILVPGP